MAKLDLSRNVSWAEHLNTQVDQHINQKESRNIWPSQGMYKKKFEKFNSISRQELSTNRELMETFLIEKIKVSLQHLL